MRKLLMCCILFISSVAAYSQTTTKNDFNLGNRAGDHLMIQIGSNSWSGAPDSISSNIKGFNPSANIYFMLDKPFKGNPKLSIGLGLGVGSNNIGFNKMEVRIASNRPVLPFVRTDTGNNYKKYKLSTSYLEVPLEFRFMSKPNMPGKSVKVALGLKVGTLINAHTRGKDLMTASGGRLNGNTIKENSKAYFNTTRIAGTARFGYGVFSIFGAYNLTSVFKDGVASEIKPLQIGITLSGL